MPTLPVEMFTNMLAYCWAAERDMGLYNKQLRRALG